MYRYRGVIIEWDPQANVEERWILQMGKLGVLGLQHFDEDDLYSPLKYTMLICVAS
jgi:hypothetical protein